MKHDAHVQAYIASGQWQVEHTPLQPAGIAINGITIVRRGRTAGRWPKYDLIVNDVVLGEVRRTLSHGSDRLAPSQLLGDGWHVHGVTCTTQGRAEATLIERAKRFGKI